jgi:hypothetical protein
MNGAQGAVILTADGKRAAANRLDHDLTRIRNYLLPRWADSNGRFRPLPQIR